MTDTCSGLRNLSEDNTFVSHIFTGYNTMIEHSEMERRGIGAILDSLKYFNPKRQFLMTTIKNDLQSATADIIQLFTYGSHDDIRPDEMAYIRYLDPRDTFVCNCGECISSVRVSLPSRFFRVGLFNPPIPQAEEQVEDSEEQAEEQAEDSEEPSIDREFRQLSYMAIDDPPTWADERLRQIRANYLANDIAVYRWEDTSISITNRGDVRIRAVQHEPTSRSILVPSNGELIMDIPSSARFSSLVSPSGGRVTISIDMQYLRDTMAVIDLEEEEERREEEEDDEEIEIDFLNSLEDVQVLLKARCFNSVVDIATSTEIDNSSCSICLEKIEANGNTLGLLGVKVKCCNKVFHDTCLRHMVCDVGPPKCPLCRTDLRTVCTDENCNHGEDTGLTRLTVQPLPSPYFYITTYAN